MWKCSMTMFLLALAVQGANPRQPSPAPYKTSWHREKYASDLFLNRRSRALDREEKLEANEQTRLVPNRQVSKSTQDLLGVCDCFVSHSARRTGCSYKIGVCLSSQMQTFTLLFIPHTFLSLTRRRLTLRNTDRSSSTGRASMGRNGNGGGGGSLWHILL